MIGGIEASEGLGGALRGSAIARSSMVGFGETLGRWSDRAVGGQEMTEQDARGAAEELVAMTFVQPILSQMREMNNAAPPFAPGIAERRFGAMWDAEIAQRLVRSNGFGLVDAVARDVLVKARGSAPTELMEPGHHDADKPRSIDTTI